MNFGFIHFNGNLVKLIILLIILITGIILIIPVIKGLNNEIGEVNKVEVGDNMELVFFGLGEADSTFIRHQNKVLLIDTGEIHQGSFIVKNLIELGVDKIDYLILTHPDKDHIGGAVEIINNFEVGMIIQSSLQEGKGLQEALNSVIREKNIETNFPEKLYEFTIGKVLVTVFPPTEYSYKKDNNYSLMTLLTHGELNYFFGGDAEKKRLEEALAYDLPKVELYKVPHHGRSNSKSADMINVLSPKFAIITSSTADAEVLEALKLQNSTVLYTGDKSIRFLSDGVKLRER